MLSPIVSHETPLQEVVDRVLCITLCGDPDNDDQIGHLIIQSSLRIRISDEASLALPFDRRKRLLLYFANKYINESVWKSLLGLNKVLYMEGRLPEISNNQLIEFSLCTVDEFRSRDTRSRRPVHPSLTHARLDLDRAVVYAHIDRQGYTRRDSTDLTPDPPNFPTKRWPNSVAAYAEAAALQPVPTGTSPEISRDVHKHLLGLILWLSELAPTLLLAYANFGFKHFHPTAERTITFQNTDSSDITRWATFGGRLQLRDFKQSKLFTVNSSTYEFSDTTPGRGAEFWNESMASCNSCKRYPIDLHNVHYDLLSESWQHAGAGNHRPTQCHAARVKNFFKLSADDWMPSLGPCRNCPLAPLDIGNAYYNEELRSWLPCGLGNHRHQACSGQQYHNVVLRQMQVQGHILRQQQAHGQTQNRESSEADRLPLTSRQICDHGFMCRKATAQVRDLRAELQDAQKRDEKQLDHLTEHTADRAGHLIVAAVAILERMIGQVTTIQRSLTEIHDSHLSAKKHLNEASILLEASQEGLGSTLHPSQAEITFRSISTECTHGTLDARRATALSL